MSLRLAVATEDLHPQLKKAIGHATQLEVDGVRLNTRSELDVQHVSDSALRQTLQYVRERQMHVAGLYCPTRHALYDSEFLEPRLDVIRRSMNVCRKLQTSDLLVRCGRIPDPSQTEVDPKQTTVSIDEQANPFSFTSSQSSPEPTEAQQFSLLTELLNDLAAHANHVGCSLNLIVSAFSAERIRQLLAKVKTGPVRITFDPATAVMTGTKPVSVYRDLYQQIGYVRARDALKDVDGAGVEVAVGDGTVDWLQLFPTLVEAEYAGWVCVERTGGDHRREDVARGVSKLKKLIPESGD